MAHPYYLCIHILPSGMINGSPSEERRHALEGDTRGEQEGLKRCNYRPM